ncbi:protein-L-isoaspartate O-methyltransferase [Candidatus Falkowbacteria bacterium]|nr:protein-L-isoaspartate O-methyltransferase [Candidatus Falkowbacteria bacterium]
MRDLTRQLMAEGVLRSPLIIEAFQAIDRADFVPATVRDSAEENYPLPIGEGQTISQPLTVALMLELLQPQPGNSVLDVGSGSGWTTALLAQMVGQRGKVFAIERQRRLKTFGEGNAEKYGFVTSGRAVFLLGDGSRGLPAAAPFDRILVSAAALQVPPALIQQLTVTGRLVLPIDNPSEQGLELIIKQKNNTIKVEKIPGFVFVPLIRD